MPYHLESIDLLVRQTPPDRMSFAIGGVAKKRRPRAIVLVRVQVSDGQGRRSWGVSADRPSFGWLDKRRTHTPDEMLSRLFELVRESRKIYLANPKFKSPFEMWARCWPQIERVAKQSDHESLSASYASALLERAIIDATCRLHEIPLFKAVTENLIGFAPEQLHPVTRGFPWQKYLPSRPRTQFHIRHTIGLSDPLDNVDLPKKQRVNDGEPETLAEYIRRDGLRYFKVKIAGNVEQDLERLKKVWNQLVTVNQPVVTLDGNESYRNIEEFASLVERLELEQLGLYQHIAFIEQPLPRGLTLDTSTRETIEKIRKRKPLVIDEADGQTDSFSRAFEIGYSGVSHKNCKGFFKSLANFSLCAFQNSKDQFAFQTGEDLSNMPIVALHQDFVALGILGIPHCERNGHHYGFGLSHLSRREQGFAQRQYPDLYTSRGKNAFLKIRNGQVACRSLQVPGFGVASQPDWESLTPLDDWEFAW